MSKKLNKGATGPKTEAGKAKSSLNALRHGYTSQKAVLICNESEQDLRDFSQIYFNRFQPADEAEGLLVEEVVAAAWRIRRLWHAETALIDMEMCRQINEPCDLEPIDETMRFTRAIESLAAKPGTPLMLIQRYTRSLRIQYNRAVRELRDMQSQRQNNPQPNEPGTQPGVPNPQPPQPNEKPNVTPFPSADPPAPLRPARRVLVYRRDPSLPATTRSQAM